MTSFLSVISSYKEHEIDLMKLFYWLGYLLMKLSYLKLSIFLVLESDRPDPKLNKAEIKYVPEQM